MCVCARVSESGLITLASVFQTHTAGFGAGEGRVWSGSPYVGRRQIEEMKVAAALP